MPKFTHSVSCQYNSTFRADAVASMFDVKPDKKLTRTWEVDLPIEEMDWKIGLIHGPSGSGKTSIAKHLYPKNYHTGYEWSSWPIIEDFPKDKSVKDITRALSSVGFSSPPDWLKPFHNLSNGQQFRAEIARLLLDDDNYPDIIVLDEFTSVVDRDVAKASSAAVQRYIRSTDKKFIAVSCHDDIIDWLGADWTYEVGGGIFTDHSTGRSERRSHPPIDLTIRRLPRTVWFQSSLPHTHYLNPNIIRSSHLWGAFWGDRLVGAVAVIKYPHVKVPNGWRSSRTVVLPDFQGLRIGVELNDAVAHHYTKQLGCRFFGRSTHPAMNHHRRNSEKWMLFTQGGTVGKTSAKGKMTGLSFGRVAESFEYVGHMRGPDKDMTLNYEGDVWRDYQIFHKIDSKIEGVDDD